MRKAVFLLFFVSMGFLTFADQFEGVWTENNNGTKRNNEYYLIIQKIGDDYFIIDIQLRVGGIKAIGKVIGKELFYSFLPNMKATIRIEGTIMFVEKEYCMESVEIQYVRITGDDLGNWYPVFDSK